MSLQIKFAILLAALAGAVLLALGAARWSLEITFREVREPVQSASNVLRLLVDIEHDVDRLRAMLDPGDSFRASAEGENAAIAPRDLASLTQALDRIETLQRQVRAEQWIAYAGRGVSDNFRSKVAEFRRAAEARFAGGRVFPDGELSATLFQLHELLKKMELRVVIDVQELASSGQDIRARLGIVLGLALVLVLLTGVLAFLLVRRWVVRPVADLRAAAARIGAGDFEHRIPIHDTSRRDEISLLSSEVNHMAGTVKKLQEERVEQERLATIGEMVRTIAHNIKTPLAGIRGLAEISRSEAAALGPRAGELREHQGRIINAVDQHTRWITDILQTMNRSGTTEVSPRPTEPGAVLPRLLEAHRPQAESSGIDLALDLTDSPATVNVDPGHLEHALSAIVSNAIQATAAHTAQNTSPRVRIISRKIKNGYNRPVWEIRIEDSGPGVPIALRQRIFEPLFTTRPGGTGIGLAVAQKVVKAHGGEIFVEDAHAAASGVPTQTGAAFVIHLPLECGPNLASTPAAEGQ